MAIPRFQRAAATRRGEALVEELGLTTLAVDPIAIAHAKGIEVKSAPVPQFSGCLIKVGNQFGIVYSTDLGNDGFVNFTVAHELGHYFLPGHPDLLFPDGDGTHQSVGGFMSSEPHEKEADAFAVGLLMPGKLFLPALRQAGSGFAAIEELARTCGTSLTATAIRYAEFAEDPVAVVLSSGGRIEFCVLSEVLQSLRGVRRPLRGDLLPPRGVSRELGASSARVRACERVGGYCSLDDWFEGAPQVEMCEDAVGLGRYGKVLTVLFSEEPIDSDGEAEDD